MSTRYSGKAFKDSSQMKTAKLSTKEKRKLKKEKKKNKVQRKLSPTVGVRVSWLCREFTKPEIISAGQGNQTLCLIVGNDSSTLECDLQFILTLILSYQLTYVLNTIRFN